MITSCQTTHGKKVLLSMGGITGGFNFWGDGPAEAFADTLWGLFGPMGSVDITLRPFGDVEVDGFDFGELAFASSFFLFFSSTEYLSTKVERSSLLIKTFL